MNAAFYQGNRKALFDALPEGDYLAVLSSGYELSQSADALFPFYVNTNFYYLTGITQPETHLVLLSKGGVQETWLFIDPFDARYAQWIGHKLTIEEAEEISGVDRAHIVYTTEFEAYLKDWKAAFGTVYADLEQPKAKNFHSFGLGIRQQMEEDHVVLDIYPYIIKLRLAKQPCEAEAIKKAIAVTDLGIRAMMKKSAPGMYEYEYEAIFDYVIKTNGNRIHSFPTIAASGINGTVMHYSTNHCVAKDGDLILFDLGCREQGYCADITRTFPVNGKFTKLQRTVYDIVLSANKAVIAHAKAGVSSDELQQVCINTLRDGCLAAGLFTDPEDIKKYYVHGVSHSIGLDTHDPFDKTVPLPEGTIISDEPGLYFPEYNLGIRIEDDLLLTKDGAINLSAAILKEADEIEAFMAQHNEA